MGESIFESGFDLRAYVAKRSLEIEDLTDRKLYRDITEKMMSELFLHLKEEQCAMEAKLLAELKSQRSQYAVCISLTDRAHYDAGDDFLVPMRQADVLKTDIPLLEAISQTSPTPILLFFLQQDAQIVRSFAEQAPHYQGQLRTDKTVYHATFRVEQDISYLKQIEALYHTFYKNHIPWNTVCTAFLTKMFHVFVDSVEGMENIKKDCDETIQSVEIDFGSYESYICQNVFPLWNLLAVQKSTSVYPSPCADHIHYEHRIFAHRLRSGCHYLVIDPPDSLQSVRHVDQDVLITCQERQPAMWELFQVNPKPEYVRPSYRYPVLTNQPDDRFSAELCDYYRHSVKTKGELRRVMDSYGYSGIVAFQDAQLLPDWTGAAQTYDMDYFITEELRHRDSQETLLLKFLASDSDDYLNMDIMSFLVTQAQKLFPEYCCKGILV